MASTATYLNFNGQTEKAFNFYKDVFGTGFTGIVRHGEVPGADENPALSDANRKLVMNVGLPITGDHLLMGSDVPEAMGKVNKGNNVYICLMPDSREEADRLLAALSGGGSVEMEMAEQFRGDYFGSCADRFGVRWMINQSNQES